MSDQLDQDLEDIEECARAGRRPRPHGPYAVKVGNSDLDFRSVVISDPTPTGRQILDQAGYRPVDQHLVFQVLNDGTLEELRLDEMTDVRERGVEMFLAFHSDRSFRFTIDDRQFEWGAARISGLTLKRLARIDAASHGVWLERRDEPDLLIKDTDQVDLSAAGAERFRTGRLYVVCIEDRQFPWPKSTITTEEIVHLGGWDPGLGVIEVDEDQNERTLAPGEVVTLKPGVVFGKKLRFKRGAP